MKSKRLALVGLVCLLVTFAFVGVVAAQGEGPGNLLVSDGKVMTFQEVLILLAGAGGGGIVMAFLMEKQQWFQSLPPAAKGALFPFLCVLIPVLSQVLLDYIPLSAWPMIERYWIPVMGGLVGYGAGTLTYYLGIKPQQVTAALANKIMARRVQTQEDKK